MSMLLELIRDSLTGDKYFFVLDKTYFKNFLLQKIDQAKNSNRKLVYEFYLCFRGERHSITINNLNADKRYPRDEIRFSHLSKDYSGIDSFFKNVIDKINSNYVIIEVIKGLDKELVKYRDMYPHLKASDFLKEENKYPNPFENDFSDEEEK